MIDPHHFVQALAQAGVDYFTGVPDSLLKSFCAYLGDHAGHREHIIAANEGTAVGLAIGYHLATGKVPLVYLQNSGLGNTLNPLTSLADPQVYATPLLLLIGWRGEPGKPDEPQHVKQGRVTLELLTTLEIPYTIIDSSHEDAGASIQHAVTSARESGGAHALVVRKGTFSNYTSSASTSSTYGWKREEAIACIADSLGNDDIVVATTGMASRELYEHRQRNGHSHEKDFLTVGGMGHASQIALGLAGQTPERQVICIDGDGAALMHLGAMATNGVAALNNFKHIVINNGVHDSVGAQPTVAFDINLVKIAEACGYISCHYSDTATDTPTVITQLLHSPGPGFLELRVDPGHRADLGRPASSPRENRNAFMSFVQR